MLEGPGHHTSKKQRHTILQEIFFAPNTYGQRDGWHGLERMWDAHGICVKAHTDAVGGIVGAVPGVTPTLQRCQRLLPSCLTTPWSTLQADVDVTGID